MRNLDADFEGLKRNIDFFIIHGFPRNPGAKKRQKHRQETMCRTLSPGRKC